MISLHSIQQVLFQLDFGFDQRSNWPCTAAFYHMQSHCPTQTVDTAFGRVHYMLGRRREAGRRGPGSASAGSAPPSPSPSPPPLTSISLSRARRVRPSHLLLLQSPSAPVPHFKRSLFLLSGIPAGAASVRPSVRSRSSRVASRSAFALHPECIEVQFVSEGGGEH